MLSPAPKYFGLGTNMKAYECFPAQLSAFTVFYVYQTSGIEKKHSNFLLIISRKGLDKHLWVERLWTVVNIFLGLLVLEIFGPKVTACH